MSLTYAACSCYCDLRIETAVLAVDEPFAGSDSNALQFADLEALAVSCIQVHGQNYCCFDDEDGRSGSWVHSAMALEVEQRRAVLDIRCRVIFPKFQCC